MIGYLTDLYDGKKSHSSDTLARALEFAERPCVNLLGATVPVWINENLSEQMIGGGFTTRVIFIYEETVRKRQLFYTHIDYDAMDKIRDNLIADLTHLAIDVQGEFKLPKTAQKYAEDWYQSRAPEWEKLGDKRLAGYYQRKHVHVIKLAMLVHLAYSDELIITKDDIENSIAILEMVEPKMIKVFQGVGKNPYTSEMDAILDFIRAKGGITKKELFSRFYHVADPVKLQELVNGLIVMGVVTVNGSDPADMKYKAVTAKRSSDRQAEAPQSEPKAAPPTES
jgi:hypothetical protein